MGQGAQGVLPHLATRSAVDFFTYVGNQFSTIFFHGQQHFLLVAISVGIAAGLSLVAGTVLHTNRLTPASWHKPIRIGTPEGLLVSSAALTVPSLALFGLLVPLVGLAVVPTVTALTIYSIYPVLRNVVAGLSSVDDAVLAAARGMGLSPVRRMVRIQIPLAWPVTLAGIRVAVLIMIGIHTRSRERLGCRSVASGPPDRRAVRLATGSATALPTRPDTRSDPRPLRAARPPGADRPTCVARRRRRCRPAGGHRRRRGSRTGRLRE